MTPEERIKYEFGRRNLSVTPEEIQEYSKLIMEVDTNIDFTKVRMTEENTKAIQKFIREYQARDRLVKHGLKPMNRILMYGASGTGKTYGTKALSNYLGFTMLYVDIAESLSQGNVAQNISKIFKLGNKLKNCIIFFDECDSIAWSRDSAFRDTRDTNSIFQQLDQMSTDNIFIGATNMLHRVDMAFARRFDMRLYFPRPKEDLVKVIRAFLDVKFTLENDVLDYYRPIIENAILEHERLSYDGIKIAVGICMKKAIMERREIIYLSEVFQEIAATIRLNFVVNMTK